MSNLRTPSAQASADVETDRSPRRKMSMDLMRVKNFGSTLSLRKGDTDTPPGNESIPASGTFSRFKAFGQSSRQSRASMGGEQADTSVDNKASRRASRLLDAFKPSKKPVPSFEVVRKPPNRSTASLHSSHQQPSPQVEVAAVAASEVPEPAPRISLSAARLDPPPPLPALNTTTLPPSGQNTLSPRSPYAPSTTRTRRLSSNLAANSSRRTSDPYLNLGSAGNSRAQSPSASPLVEPANGSFSLHSFRNVRSTSDVSTPDDPASFAHSRVQSIVSVDEYVTPGEELPEPRYFDESGASNSAHLAAFPEQSRAQSVSPVSNAKPASISAAKFRQASRQRSESGTIPNLDTVQGGSGFMRPPRSRTPSQDLAAMEAVLAQTNKRASRNLDQERRKSVEPATLSAPASGLQDNSGRPKRGFFIVVEGLDRAGKSTQVERLAEHLKAKAIKFPERTTAIGQMINSYLAQTSDLDDQAIHLLFSANRWECVASIKKTLEAGESIVCDRYAFSGIAYSVAKGLSYDWCRNPDVGLPLPDLTIFLDLDAQTAAARGGYGEERYEKLDFQAKVRDAFSRVSADVKAHGGRWTTIDASKTLDEVTADIQKAVQRVTSSIDRVGARLGQLFVSQRPSYERQGSSTELYPPGMPPSVKRLSQSSEDSARRGKSLDQPRIQINTSTSNGTFPVSGPSGSPLTYTEQLAAVRAAAAGTLSGFFGGSNATLDQQTASPNGERSQSEADGPSAANGLRGQGFDSARVLGKHVDNTGRRRTLIDVIGEIEKGQPAQANFADHRRSMSAAVESTSPTVDAYPSTFAQAGRVRRSTDHGKVSQLPTINSNGAQPNVAPRSASLTVQSGGADGASPDAERPSTHSLRATSYTSAGAASGSSGQSPAPSPGIRQTTLSPAPALRTASPGMTNSSRSSMASPPLPAASTSPIQRPASASPGDYAQAYTNFNAADPNSLLNAQHLSMLNAQQGQADMQEQYMRNYMAMMANPVMAQQAHYQMMLQRHQQQYYGRAASAIGPGYAAGNVGAGANGNGVATAATQQGGTGPPLAAFMQPSAAQAVEPGAVTSKPETQRATSGGQRERMRSTHKRTQSSGSLLETNAPAAAATSASGSQPMLSMMMAPPPPMTGSHSAAASPTTPTFPSQYFQQQHGYAAQQQIYAAQQQQLQQQQMFYGNGAGFPQMAGWGAYGGRPMYASTRSEIASPSGGLRQQRSSEKGLRAQGGHQ